MSELERRVGEGSLEVISKEINEVDSKDIGKGIRVVVNSESRINSAENKMRAKAQEVTIQEEIDPVGLVDELKADMGEETVISEEKEQEKSNDFER